MSVLGPSRTSGEVRVESAKHGIADIAGDLEKLFVSFDIVLSVIDLIGK
jgi:hypothetical protein